ncbi:dihydrofolate reductase family protein [Actinomadura roseirufa]|uniref:dihydrofolate reductase family protein n=1 Tax=Actinomadura roseirufa TaxID=2094049 RepID=UPI00104127FC|nr:dihydrofolate reductase family protein [Actinomadura roseirufa]
MRRITAELFSTLDGVVDAPEKWHIPFHTDAMAALTEETLAASDTMLLGRATYLEHAGYWPDESGRLADLMNGIHKIVYTTTLTDLAWNNSTPAAGDIAARVRELKDGPGGGIAVTGSVSVVRALLRAGLLDELRLIIDPVVAGTGERLFEEGLDHATFGLVESRAFDTGALSVTYSTAPRP